MYIAIMTRGNVSPVVLLPMLLAFCPSTKSVAFSFQARHNGKSHNNHLHNAIDARQSTANGPAVGIGAILNPVTTILLATSSTLSLPTNEQLETVSAMDAGAFAEPEHSSPTSRSVAKATVTSFAPPIFPGTVLQIPIYTVCPDTPGYLNANSVQPSNITDPKKTATTPIKATASTPTAFPIAVNATAFLTKGSYTTFLSQSLFTPSLTPTPPPDARIILGKNGCQTLYSALTTQVCSTTITRGGQLPILVTDCGQWVTFSSSRLSGAMTPGSTCNCPSMLTTSTELVTFTLAYPSISAVDGEGVASISETDASNGFAFFAAPWYEIAAGVIPGFVQISECGDESGESCTLSSSERWSVSTKTSIMTTAETVVFAGPVLLSHPSGTTIQAINYSTIQTTTTQILLPTIIRSPIGAKGVSATPPNINAPERTVTMQMTLPPQIHTWALEQVHRTTRVTVTVTVEGTVRVTHTKTVTMV